MLNHSYSWGVRFLCINLGLNIWREDRLQVISPAWDPLISENLITFGRVHLCHHANGLYCLFLLLEWTFKDPILWKRVSTLDEFPLFVLNPLGCVFTVLWVLSLAHVQFANMESQDTNYTATSRWCLRCFGFKGALMFCLSHVLSANSFLLTVFADLVILPMGVCTSS